MACFQKSCHSSSCIHTLKLQLTSSAALHALNCMKQHGEVMIDCMLHVPLHSSQMDFQGLLVVCRAHASLHLLALFYPSIASVVQNPLLFILTSILISLSRCNCSSTLLPSQASCHALTSLIWWSLKSMVSMVFGLVFQAPCLLPLIHILSVYSTPSPVCSLYLCDV